MSWCLAVSHAWPTLDKPFWLDVGNISLSPPRAIDHLIV